MSLEVLKVHGWKSNVMDNNKSNALEPRNLETLGLTVTMDAVTFAKRLKEARLAAGLTQEQLAQACGVTNRAVSAWEKGRASDILAENLFAAADKLKVDPRWLATGHEDQAKAAVGIAKEIRELDPEQLEAIRSLVHSMKR